MIHQLSLKRLIRSGVVVWDREDYLAEPKKQPDDQEVYQQLPGDAETPLEKNYKKGDKKT